jgi:predicted transcriptional regulator
MVQASKNTLRSDAILPMRQPWMEYIANGSKNFEFRKYRISDDVKRIWFYVTAPESRISHICEVEPARTRLPGDEPLPLNGYGNKEWNEHLFDSDFAYEIKSVYELNNPVTLQILKERYGLGGAPRGLVYVSEQLALDVPWQEQKMVLSREKREEMNKKHIW